MKTILLMIILSYFFVAPIIAADNIVNNLANNDEQHIQCPEERSKICTREYRPVCAINKNNQTNTYSNSCVACADTQVVSYQPNACPIATLNAEQVTQLFSNTTYKASIPSRNLTMSVYVDPDGSMRGMQAGRAFKSRWEVSEQGEICVSYKDKMRCRFVMNDKGQYKKYKLNEQGEKVILVIYESFLPGNINNY